MLTRIIFLNFFIILEQRLLLVGSNDRETKFRCLEIDRTARADLKFHEYPSEYDARGIRSLVGTLGQCKVSIFY